jgi:hypothetical protein
MIKFLSLSVYQHNVLLGTRGISHLDISFCVESVSWSEIFRNPIAVHVRELCFVLFIQRYLSLHHMLTEKYYVWYFLQAQHLL